MLLTNLSTIAFYRIRMSSPHVSYHPILSFLLLLGGVEPNPGPAPILAPRHNAGLLNVRSAVNKAALLHALIDGEKLDFLAVTETWLRSDDPPAILDDIAPPG